MTTRDYAEGTGAVTRRRQPEGRAAYSDGRSAVGFIGLGAMGQPMSSRLLSAGVPVVGYDINSDAVCQFAAGGGVPARDLRDVISQASVLITSLPTFVAVDDVVGAVADLHRSHSFGETILIESSTLSVEQKQAIAATATAAGVEVFDCPVSGTSAQAINGDLVGYLSGPDGESANTVKKVMGTVCRATYWMGEFGNGIRTKLVANLLVAVHNVAAAEALLLAGRAGLDVDLVLESVGDGAGSSRMLQVRGPLMARGQTHHATARVDLIQKDIAAIRMLADSLGSPTPLLDVSSSIYDIAAQRGLSGHDAAAVYRVLDEPSIDRRSRSD